MADQAFEAVVIGAVGIDTNVYLPCERLDFEVEATFCSSRDCVGQAGGYSSRQFAALGHRTAFIGAVGDDHPGRMIREALAGEGIDLTGLFTDPEGTKRSINLMYSDGRRNNFYDGRGAMTIEPDLEHCRAILRGARLAHFNIVNWSRLLLPVAREQGVTVSTDLQDVVEIDDAYRRDYVEQSDILFFSCVNFDDPRPFIEHFFEVGRAEIIVTGLGARGCAVATREGIEFFEPVTMDEPVIDTNGAGDCLAVGFLSSHVLGDHSLEESARRGQICARHMCTQRSERTRFLTRGGLDKL
jgi:acarbose 7IV-phosphotransferase